MIAYHRISIGETLLLGGVVVGSGLLALRYEIDSITGGGQQIDLYEAAIIGSLFLAGILYLGWRRIADLEREIARRRAAEKRAHELAHTDALTGLANRRQFEQALKEAAASPPGAQSRTPCSHST